MRRLIIRPGAIGDVILALPAMEFLRADYTEVWVRGDAAPLVRFAGRARAIAATGLDLVGLPDREPPAVTLELLSGFDEIVSWYGANREEFRSAVARLPFRFLAALPDAPGVHAADFYLAQVGGRGPAIPCIECTHAGGDYAVLHPFSGSPKKNWPLARFRDLARALAASMPVCWCAGPEEELPGAVRKEDLFELACWLAGARVYVGNDSGISHLAAAVGTRTIAIFGPTDPRIWAPRGPNVTVVAKEKAGEPIDSVPVEAVLAAIRS